MAPGTYELEITATNDGGSTTAALTVVIGMEDLRITVTSSDSIAQVGETMTLTVTVTNIGNWVALEVLVDAVLSDPLLQILTVSASQGEADLEARHWSIGRLKAGEEVTMTIEGRVIIPDLQSWQEQAMALAENHR
jgi:uncharacterized repeat protein (TIGR01451 family)